MNNLLRCFFTYELNNSYTNFFVNNYRNIYLLDYNTLKTNLINIIKFKNKTDKTNFAIDETNNVYDYIYDKLKSDYIKDVHNIIDNSL